MIVISREWNVNVKIYGEAFTIIHREKSLIGVNIPSKAVASRRVVYNWMSSTLYAIIRLKISDTVIARVHSVVVALARYVTEFDSIQRDISDR